MEIGSRMNKRVKLSAHVTINPALCQKKFDCLTTEKFRPSGNIKLSPSGPKNGILMSEQKVHILE